MTAFREGVPQRAMSKRTVQPRREWVRLPTHPDGAGPMSRVIKLYTPKQKNVSLPKTAALTKAQVEHKAWLKAHGIKVTKNSLKT